MRTRFALFIIGRLRGKILYQVCRFQVMVFDGEKMRAMTEPGRAQQLLAEAGVLPREMPRNFTYDKVREVLTQLEDAEPLQMHEAIAGARRLEIKSPLAAVIFIRHHVAGAHEVEVDRLEENEGDGTRYAVLTYPEGEVPIKVEHLPEEVGAGSRLQYQSSEGRFTIRENGQVP